MRRIVLVLVAINAALLAIGAALAPARPARGLGRRIHVGLVFDVGGRGDRSFNDAAARGLERAAAELGAAVETIEPGDGGDRETALRQLAAGGADLVIGVGFIFSNDLDRLAADFPNTRFAGIDYSPTPGRAIAPNLLALTFREHEAAFVVGAIAGLVTRSHTVGFVGGMKIPLIRKFEAGYTAGVHHECPGCTVLAIYAGSEPKAFADPTRGRELASAQYDRGADIIFHAAGKTGDGVFAAARDRHLLAIGVDSDQYDQAPCCIVASMVKRVDVTVYDEVRAVLEGRFTGGVRELGLAEDGVGFVARDDELLPPAVRRRAEQLAADVIAGRITVPSQ
ncbi:MAG: BMP family ABC transporter substrate-binding protein [Deltaproteobacteria bacterium]|nr:BMP family ABC transporter substrate-binding protein [Deltaproteobacteria bacterium]